MVGLSGARSPHSRAVESMVRTSAASRTQAIFGREREIAEMYGALTSAAKGDTRVLLVRGDAGIGKTTLISDLARRAGDLGFTVAVGHCLDIDADISLAPAVEAVRQLLAGRTEFDERPFARRMTGLLDAGTSDIQPAPMLDDIRMVVLEAAASGPVLLVLEDLHWADQSTRDLLIALSRTAAGRLLVVLTFRGDELHRRHPLRSVVAELGRLDGARRVDLGPLDGAAISALVQAHPGPIGVRRDPSQVLERSEGNPLYAEELLDADGAIPGHLSDLLLARVDGLSEETRQVLRMASVGGSQINTEVLPALTGLDQARIEAVLREALDANVIRQVSDSLQRRSMTICSRTSGAD
jgi:predicted ATPase